MQSSMANITSNKPLPRHFLSLQLVLSGWRSGSHFDMTAWYSHIASIIKAGVYLLHDETGSKVVKSPAGGRDVPAYLYESLLHFRTSCWLSGVSWKK